MRKRWGSFHIKFQKGLKSYDPENQTQFAFPVAIPGDVDDRLDDSGNSIRGTGIGHPE